MIETVLQAKAWLVGCFRPVTLLDRVARMAADRNDALLTAEMLSISDRYEILRLEEQLDVLRRYVRVPV